MNHVVANAPRSYRLWSSVRSAVGYCGLKASNLGAMFGGATPQEQRVNAMLTGYPSNHIYRVHQNRLIPGRQLYDRCRQITPWYSPNLESFLDIGCCKGFYTSQVAQRTTTKVSVGIDVHAPFIETCNDVSDVLGLTNTQYHVATLDKVAESPTDFGGPFQTVLLIGSYHYLFWGSAVSDHCFKDHGEILSRLAAICTDRVIISARFEIGRLPRDVREAVAKTPQASVYNTGSFVTAASDWFSVESHGFLGTYPLLVLKKKKTK